MLSEGELAALFGADATARVHPVLAKVYQRVVERSWAALRQALELQPSAPPALLTVHSLVARPQTLVGATGDVLVIYDQYFGQIVNQLTRLAVGDAAPAIVDVYLAKLLCHRYFVAGNLRGATALRMLSQASAEHASTEGFRFTESEAMIQRRSDLVGLQEEFFIAHELSHILLEEAGPRLRASFDPMLDYVLDYLLRAERSGSAAEPEADGAPTEAAERYWARIAAVFADRRVREEMACDHLAALLLVGGTRSPGGLGRALSGAGLALLNLRLVKFLDDYARSKAPADANVASYFLESGARYWALHIGMGMTLAARGSANSGWHQTVGEGLVALHDLNSTHHRVLQDRVHRALLGRAQRIMDDSAVDALAHFSEDLAFFKAWLRMPAGTSLAREDTVLYGDEDKSRLERYNAALDAWQQQHEG